MQIIEKDIDELIPYVNNPRNNTNAIDAVASSINEFGFKVPCVIDRNNILVTGHTRLLAAKKLGIKKVPVIVADDLTDAQIKAFRLADNKVSELAEWDEELLNIELQELEDIDFNMDGFGFDFGDFEDISEVEQDEVPEIDETVEPKTQKGQIYKLGNHRLMCGDSTSLEDVAKLVNGQQIDLLITDPPYNVAYEGGTKDHLTILNDNMGDSNFRQFLVDVYKSADSVMKPGAVFYIWYADVESYNFNGACIDVGWEVRQCLIWVKPSLILGRKDYHWRHEPCLYGWKDGACHTWNSDRKQTTVLEFDKPLKNDIHPTMKPVPLFAYQIKNSSLENANVLDLFGGSGTTLIACEQLKRKAYLMELDPRYCDAIINRWETLTGQKAELVNE